MNGLVLVNAGATRGLVKGCPGAAVVWMEPCFLFYIFFFVLVFIMDWV